MVHLVIISCQRYFLLVLKDTKATGALARTRQATGLPPMDLRDARFHHDGSIIPPGAQRTDHYGRSVYFIARDGQLFGKHILPYLVTNDANISSFAEDFKFWRQLRNEATLFTVSTHSRISCTLRIRSTPRRMEIKVYCIGLGTDKGAAEYRNPYARGAVVSRVGST